MTFAFHDHELDIGRRELRRGGAPVAIEPQVFDLLVHLIRNRERVVSKDELIASIWGGRIVSESAVTTRLNAARRAVGDTGATQSLIRTVPRKGVRFVGEVTERGTLVAAECAVAPLEAVALALPDRPSIAVLPFVNMSSDPEQEYFADGITEDIVTALSKWRWFFVIARNSSFTYRGRDIDVERVGRELGVRYVLEGSVRKAGNRVRITAQLVEAETGSHLWADRYDRQLIDIFAVQEEVTRNIAAAIEPALTRTEGQVAVRKPPADMLAWDFFLHGQWHFHQMSADSRAKALACFERAAVLDGDLADAHVGIARTLHGNAVYGHSTDSESDLHRAITAARRALELDNDNAYAWYILAMTQATHGEAAVAVESACKAVELNPNMPWGHFALAVASLYRGQIGTALTAIDMALRLSPNDPQRFAWLATRASALFLLRRYDEAIQTALQSRSAHRFTTASRVLAASYGQLDLHRQAAVAVVEMLEVGGTERTIADVIRPFTRLADREHYSEGLRKAGLRET
ncbi:MAG TPA: winged helix-turn-helix domain-containing protein [Acetobacteraceae bacterium]